MGYVCVWYVYTLGVIGSTDPEGMSVRRRKGLNLRVTEERRGHRTTRTSRIRRDIGSILEGKEGRV